jgi:hypothetical protein
MVPLDAPLPNHLAEEFTKFILFADKFITDFRFAREDAEITAVIVTTEIPVAPDELARKLRIILYDHVFSRDMRQRRVVWESRSQRGAGGTTFEQLAEQGAVFQIGPGQVALGSPLLTVTDRIDSVLRRLAVERFEAREFSYPALIPATALQRCGYLARFPQRAIFATHLRCDADVHRSFVESVERATRINFEVFGRCEEVRDVLAPAMCLHTFNHCADTVLPARMSAVTSKGRILRDGGRYHHALERLRDFTVREIVFIGSRNFVITARRRFMRQILTIVDMLEISARCEVANALFPNPQGAAATPPSPHRFEEPKYELLLDVADDTAVAAASFNYHDRFYGQSFDIMTTDGETAYTACAGISLERFSYAFIGQHGSKASAWPRAARYLLRTMADIADRTIGNGN